MLQATSVMTYERDVDFLHRCSIDLTQKKHHGYPVAKRVGHDRGRESPLAIDRTRRQTILNISVCDIETFSFARL
jgi:hypothetical protein